MSIAMDKKKYLILLLSTLLLVILVPFLNVGASTTIILVALFYTAVVFFINSKAGVLFLLLLRPSLDILADQKITLGGFYFNFSYVIGGLSLLFFLHILLKKKNKLKNYQAFLPWGFFLFIAFISIFFSYSPTSSFVEFLRLFSIFSLYVLSLTLFKEKKDFRNLLAVIVSSAIIPGILAAHQYFAQSGITLPFEGIYNRIYGTFAHPNLFAYYLMIPISLLVFLLIKKQKRNFEEALLLLFLPFLMILLGLTFTRGAWLAFLIFVFIITIIRFRKALPVIMVALLLSYFLVEPIHDRVNNLIMSPYSSVQWRIELWKDAFGYARQKPLLGQGTGVAKEFILDKRGEQFGSSDPHNDYLKVFLENGLLGLLSYLFLVLFFVWKLFKKYLSQKEPDLKLLSLIILSLTISFYTLSFADNLLRNTALQWAYWAILGGYFASLKARKVN